MLLPMRRSAAFACLALVTGGCTSTRRLDPPTVIQPDGATGRHRIIGATLKDGRDMRFDVNASTVVRVDTLRTSVARQATLIPLADLQSVWVTSTNVKKTTLLLVGLGALYLAVGAMAAQSIDYGPWPTN
jgi:hypothetical protein